MQQVLIRLDPDLLANPNADLRYEFPDLLHERSGGAIVDDGYDYLEGSGELVLFLKVSDVESALICILDVVENVRLLNNDLRQATTVAVKSIDTYGIVYPPALIGTLLSL